MRISIEEERGVTIVSLDGRIDATTTAIFEDNCKKIFEASVTAVIIDMQYVEYISSAGLRSVLMMLKLGKEKSVRFVFCALSDMVSEVFRISGFTSLLSIYPTKKEALAALSA